MPRNPPMDGVRGNPANHPAETRDYFMSHTEIKTSKFRPALKHRKCTVLGCDRRHQARGYCPAHYLQWYKHGEVIPNRPFTKSRFGKENGRWMGGKITNPDGRVLIYCPNHPNPTTNGTHVYRYRLVMEKYLGRFLKSSEIVHHKNGDPSDDRICNLEVMTQSKHAKLHKDKKGKFSR